MRAPLKEMNIRTPRGDSTHTRQPKRKDAGDAKNHIRRALGGTMGTNVRGAGTIHQGWDLYAVVGTPVFSIAPGVVAVAENNANNATRLGRYLSISFEAPDPDTGTSSTFYALYAHLNKIDTSKGKRIEEGAVLGRTGTTGNAEGGPPHLHFAIMRGPHPKKGLGNHYLDPGHFLGFQHLNFDTLFPNWSLA